MTSAEMQKTEKKSTVNICLREVSGKQLYSLIEKAVGTREKETGDRTFLTDFCAISGISRTQIYAYRKGEKPGAEGVMKVVSGLKAWGNEVAVNF